MRRGDLLCKLKDGSLLETLRPVYGEDTANGAERLSRLIEESSEFFPSGDDEEILLFSTPGRTEICGNHTDHQHGHGLAASIDLDTIACVIPNGGNTIRVKSRYHRIAVVELEDLSIRQEEIGTSMSLVRGVAAKFRELGYPVTGFDAYTTTRVLRGSGLSSSAAFEVLMATIMNHLFCGGALSDVELAQVGRYAENVYFQKPCGLADQLACAVGGMIDVDLRDPAHPQVERMEVDFGSYGYALCIVDSRASHSDLTDDFAAIPREMESVAAFFGKHVLAEVSYQKFMERLSDVRIACGDRAALRAYHFFHDERRVKEARCALQQGDFQRFLKILNRSGLSSMMYLQNVSTYRDSRSQPILMLLALAAELLHGRGAARVHGGGFAGTIQAFVPLDMLDEFISGMEVVTGQGTCHVISVRSRGTTLLIP